MDAQTNVCKVLCTIVCAAPPATYIQDFVQQAQQQHWECYIIATPYATRFIDIPLLTALTGYPVKSDYRYPQEKDSLPKADIVAVPCLKQQLAKHPVFSKNLALLRECGVHILHEPERYPSPQVVPWSAILGTLNHVIGNKE